MKGFAVSLKLINNIYESITVIIEMNWKEFRLLVIVLLKEKATVTNARLKHI